MESHPYLLHRQCRLISATLFQLFRIHIKTVLSNCVLSLEPSSEQQLTLVQDDSAGRRQLLNRLVLGSFGLLCLSVRRSSFPQPNLSASGPKSRPSRTCSHSLPHSELDSVLAADDLSFTNGEPRLALRRCTTASELVAPSRSRSVSQSLAPALDPVDPHRLLGLLRPASHGSDSS